MTTMKTTLAALAMAALTLSAGEGRAEELSFAHFVPPAHTITSAVVEPFSKGVSEASDLTVRVYPGGELGAGPVEQYVRVLQGVADLGWGLQGYTSSQFPKTMVAELPGVIETGKFGYPALWAVYDDIKDEYPGTIPVALWTSEPNILIMKDRDIRTPADLAGLKIRVSGSAAAAAVEALGATPVQMPANEIYNSLQTGLIDGVVTGASAVTDFKIGEVANSYTLNVPLGRITFFVVMNEARYNGLTDEEKAAIDKVGGLPLSESAERGWNAKADATIEALKADSRNTVIELTPEESKAFADLTMPVTQRIVGEIGAEKVLETMQSQ